MAAQEGISFGNDVYHNVCSKIGVEPGAITDQGR
jgi:hypothetical protein